MMELLEPTPESLDSGAMKNVVREMPAVGESSDMYWPRLQIQ